MRGSRQSGQAGNVDVWEIGNSAWERRERDNKKKKKHGENGHADGVREMNCPYSERSVV